MIFRTFLLWLMMMSPTGFGAGVKVPETSPPLGAPAQASSNRAEEHGLPQQAVEIARPFGFPITNSMLVTWIVAVGLIAFAQVATRQMKQIPGGAQNFWEWLVESLSDFLESVIGSRLTKRTFWFFASVFIFILFANWAGLIPGVGTVTGLALNLEEA